MRLVQTKRLIAVIPSLLLFSGAVSLHAQTGPTYYYVSPDGNDSNPGTESLPWKTLSKAASMATAGMTIFIKQGTYSERLLPVNSGRVDAPITFTSYPGDSVTITGVGMTPPTGWWAGLIWLQGLKYIKISGLRVISSVNIGIDVENSSHIAIEKNYVDSSYSSGIKVYASDNIVIDANEVVRGCIGSDLEECISVATTDLVEIHNNRVHDGRSIGIDVKYGSSNASVRKNEVYSQNGGIGIYIEAWTLHEFNIDVFDNFSHDNAIGFAVTSEMGGLIEAITVHHNIAQENQQRGIAVVGWGGGQTHPVKNVKVYENTVWGNGFGIEIGGYIGTTLDSIGVFNNLIYRNKNAGVRITRYDGPSGEYAMRNVSIMNNTIYGNGTVGNGWDADNGGMNIFNTRPVNMLIQDNILSNNAVCTIYVSPEVLAGSLTIDYNLFDGFRNFVNENVGTNVVYGIPLFVDSLRNDYHLRATSPCVDKGNPSQEHNDPQDPYKPGYALYPAQGTIRNDMGAYGGPYAASWDLATSVARPQTPVLYSPADSARGVSTSPRLSWNGILGADRYRVQLSTSPSFGNMLVDDSMVTDSYRQVGVLTNNTAYYWRVSATNVGGTSSYSAVRTFTTIVAAPQAPVLATPADSTKDVQLSTTLSWNAVSGATTYNLQLSTASSFASLVVNDSTITETYRATGPLTLATTYYWRVRARNDGGYSTFSQVRLFSTIGTTSTKQLRINIPTEYSLSPNYPNPFNPSTTIRYGSPHKSSVQLTVYNTLGQQVATLVQGEQEAGYHEVRFDGSGLSSGVYFYRIEAGSFVQTRTLVLLK